jgi:ABC-type Zn2+ transport system substrate-binding protein/surface adhesin
MNHGILMRVMGDDFPRDQTVAVHLGKAHDHGHNHEGGHDHAKDTAQNTDEEHALVATYINEDGTEKAYELEACMSLQNTSSTWQDLSISKNVFAMLLALVLLLIVFFKNSQSLHNTH